jgi:hypothetical protein
LETDGFEVRRGTVTVWVPTGEDGTEVERMYDGAVNIGGEWFGVEAKGAW